MPIDINSIAILDIVLIAVVLFFEINKTEPITFLASSNLNEQSCSWWNIKKKFYRVWYKKWKILVSSDNGIDKQKFYDHKKGDFDSSCRYWWNADI